MNISTQTIVGQYVSRSMKKNFICFNLQENGLFTMKEYKYSNGYQYDVENGFFAKNVTIKMCLHISNLLECNFNDLESELIQIYDNNFK